MIGITDRRTIAAALRVSLVSAAALLGTNVYPIRSRIITSDDGVWEGSWKRDYGWPRPIYQEWGYDPSIRMYSWDEDGIIFNGRLILGSSLAVFVAAMTLLSLSRDSRFALRDPSS